MQEEPLVGWVQIAKYLGWTYDKAIKRIKEFRERGILFETLRGRPPKRRRIIFTYPSLLREYLQEISINNYQYREKKRKAQNYLEKGYQPINDDLDHSNPPGGSG